MANFSALKTSIQNYIKQNGNEEITGNLLQQILLSMVTTLGDSAINDLVTALNTEIANRGNADIELGGRITTLQGVVNGIKANIENGYVYAGIATPSTTPASGKVFYLALTAGTYTNFGATVVPQGINILKYNGSAWSLDIFLGLDDAPAQDSNNLVKSGGIFNTFKSYGNKMQNISVLSGYNIGADGSLSSGGSQNPFIYNVEGVKCVILRYTIYSNVAVAPYAIYSSLKEFSSTTALVVAATSAKTSPTTYEVMVSIPDGAKALLVTSRDVYTPEVYSSTLVMADFIKDATLEIEKDSIISSKAVWDDGELAETTTFNVWTFDVENAYAVLFDFFFKSGGALYEFAFYDSETIFDSSTCIFIGPKTVSSSGITKSYFVKVPTNAKRLLINCRAGEENAHCYTTKIKKVIDGIKNSISENSNIFNQFSNKTKMIESLSFAEKSPLALTSLDYVGVNDFHKVRFEGNVGEVYTTTSENVGNQWYTSKLPVQKGFDAIVFGVTSSAFNGNILLMDSSDVILYKTTFSSNSNGNPFYIKVSDYPTAAYISFMRTSDYITHVYFLPALSKEHELNAEFRPKSEMVAYKYDGTISEPAELQPFNYYKIDVSQLKNFVAYVDQYSGASVMSISYFDKNGNYISSEYKQDQNNVWRYLFCTVPANASYAQILSREEYSTEIQGIYNAKVYALSPMQANKYNGTVTNNIANKNVEQHEYQGERINFNTFRFETVGRNIITAAANNPIHPQDTTNGQGGCTYGDFLFRLHNNGYCNIYNIKYLENITKVNGFELGSYGNTNHANCASFSPQIDPTTKFPYLYVAGGYKKCYVERISLEGSTLLQTITLDLDGDGDILIGDDGYLYAVFSMSSYDTTLRFYKLNCPDINDGDVTLTIADVVDTWTWTDEAENIVFQGGFFRNGKLYICFGQSDGAAVDVDRNINVYDWIQKDRVSYIPLKPYESHEPEDIYPYKGKIFMVVNGANEAYILDFVS